MLIARASFLIHLSRLISWLVGWLVDQRTNQPILLLLLIQWFASIHSLINQSMNPSFCERTIDHTYILYFNIPHGTEGERLELCRENKYMKKVRDDPNPFLRSDA